VVTGDVPVPVRSPQLAALTGVPEALAAAGDTPGPGVLILGTAPVDGDLQRARSLAARPDTPWAVVVIGRTHYDQWRFTAGPDGRLDTGSLGVSVSRRAGAS